MAFYYKKPTPKRHKNELIKGIHAIWEALNENKTIRKVFIQKPYSGQQLKDLIYELKRYKIPFSEVPREKLDRIAGENHQGIVGLISPVEFTEIEDLVPQLYENGSGFPLLIMLDEITDVRNFGAIARSAFFFNADGIIVPEKGSADINSDAVKASSGALLKMNICRSQNLYKTVIFLKNSGFQIISCSEKATEKIQSVSFLLPTLIIFGNEETGISESLLKLSDQRVRIDGITDFDSLNVSVAAGIALYEISRQKSL